MVQMTRITKHRNQHIVIKTYNNVIFILKLLIAKQGLKEILGYDLKDNGKNTNTDLFKKKTVMLVGGILLQNYIC